MSLLEVYSGQQTWANYVSNRDLARRFENSLTKAGDRIALSSVEQSTAMLEGLGAIENSMTSEIGVLEYELQNVAAGISGLRADFHILMGDVVWKLERQTATLKEILRTLQVPLDTASKELRARAEDAYRNGWYEEALADFLQSEQKNYQDFAVHRSIGNIHLYHLEDLPKACEYFQKAAKYARPRDTKQAAEAEYFAGVAFGLQQKFDAALTHMREATSLDPEFCDAYYSCATFAMLLGRSPDVLQSLQKAILGDARYFERCRHDPCFGSLRVQIDTLLERLFAAEDGESNFGIAKLKQVIQRLREMGVGEKVLQEYSTQLRELEVIKGQGHYSGYSLVTARASGTLKRLLDSGMKSLDEAAVRLTEQIAGRTTELQNGLHRIEQEWASTQEQMKSCEMPLMTGLLIVSLILLFLCKPPFSNVLSGALSVVGLIIGAVWLWTAGRAFVRFFALESKAKSLASQASQARQKLQPGADEVIERLDSQQKVVRQHREELNGLLSGIVARIPAKLLN